MKRPIHGILPGEIQKLTRYAKDKEMTLWESLANLEEYPREKTALTKFREEMDRLFDLYGKKDLYSLVRAILFGRDFLRVEIAEDNMHNIRLINRFMKLTSRYLDIYPDANLEEYLMHIQTLAELGLEDAEKEPSKGKIHLMTIHGTKGKEFPHVFIPCLNDKRLPSRYQKYKIAIPDDLADGFTPEYSPEELHYQEERRLFYVALTRGKQKVHLSYCKRYGTNKRDTPKSMYLTEITEPGEGFEHTEIEEDFEEEIEEMAEDIKGILKQRIIGGIQRGEYQTAIDAMTALAMKEDIEISNLKIPQTLNVTEYIDALKGLFEEAEVAHAERKHYSPSRLKCYDD